MKRFILSLFIAFIIICGYSDTTYAKVRTDAIKNGSFTSLSDEDMKDTITALVSEISSDLQVATVPRLYFYSAKEWLLAASYYPGIDYIYVNLSTFEDSMDADAVGETVEYHLLRIMAHEVRHDYQYEHMNDDSDYGRAIKANNQNYVSYYNDLEAYNNQFIEQDANDYADSYVKKYFNLVR